MLFPHSPAQTHRSVGLLSSTPPYLLLKLCLLPATFDLLPSTFYLPPSTFCLLPSTYLPPSTFHLLPSTFHFLLFTFYLLPSTFYVLPPILYILPSTFYLLHSSHLLVSTSYLRPSTSYLLPSTFYLPPSTSYLLPSTFYLLPSTFNMPGLGLGRKHASTYLLLSTVQLPPATFYFYLLPSSTCYFLPSTCSLLLSHTERSADYREAPALSPPHDSSLNQPRTPRAPLEGMSSSPLVPQGESPWGTREEERRPSGGGKQEGKGGR